MKEYKQKIVVLLFSLLFCMFIFRTFVFAIRIINEGASYLENGKRSFLPNVEQCQKNKYKNTEEIYLLNYLNIGQECKSI